MSIGLKDRSPLLAYTAAPGQHRRTWTLRVAALALVVIAITMTVVGIAAIATTEPSFAKRQAAFAAVGIVAGLLVLLPSPERLKWAAEPLYVISLEIGRAHV